MWNKKTVSFVMILFSLWLVFSNSLSEAKSGFNRIQFDNVTMSLPDGFQYVTPETAEGDSILGSLGVDVNVLKSILEAQNYAMLAFDSISGRYIYVVKDKNPSVEIKNANNYSDMLKFKYMLLKSLDGTIIQVNDSEIYGPCKVNKKTRPIYWVKVKSYNVTYNVFIVLYVTFFDGYIYDVAMETSDENDDFGFSQIIDDFLID